MNLAAEATEFRSQTSSSTRDGSFVEPDTSKLRVVASPAPRGQNSPPLGIVQKLVCEILSLLQ
jgi:hypothetical protein